MNIFIRSSEAIPPPLDRELASFAEGPSACDSCQNILIQSELIRQLFTATGC